MKLRLTVLAFASLLMTGSLANATPTAQSNTPVVPVNGDVAIMTPAEASPGCAEAELPFLSTAPSERLGGPCGPCSETSCQGKRVDQICGFSGGKYYTCEVPYGEVCGGQPITFNCSCWYGPLP